MTWGLDEELPPKHSTPGLEGLKELVYNKPEGGMLVLGIDPSLTGTGIAAISLDLDGNVFGATATTLKVPGKVDTIDRIFYIARNVTHWVSICSDRNLSNIIIEDLPAMAKGAGHTGQAQGAIRYGISSGSQYNPCQVLALAPATLKKFIAGSGKADKAAVIEAVRERVGHLTTINDDNQGDAMALALYGAGIANHRGPVVPQKVVRPGR